MNKMLLRLTCLPLALSTLALAGGASAQGFKPLTEEVLEQPVSHPAVVTHHTGTFNGHLTHYTATVEGQVVTSGPKHSQADLVSFAYTKDGADPRSRPVMFLFNGGPIVASAFIHIGGLGPKRIAFPTDVHADPSTFRLVDNEYSPLDAVDMVFVDPASTGFSRVMPGTKIRDYFSNPTDAAQVVAFIHAWLHAHGREQSPIYVMGESYGTHRAAEIANQMASGPNPTPLAGIMLYGQALNIVEMSQRPNNVISYAISLPTLAALASYHGKAERRGRSFEQYLADARQFAVHEYLPALFQGDSLAPAQRATIARKLQEYSGIPSGWYLDHRLRISKELYRAELLKDRGLLLGRDDARYTAPIGPQGSGPDPSDVLSDAVMRMFPAYIKNDLGVTWTEPYSWAAPIKGLEDWSWGFGTSPFGDWPYQAGITKMMNLNPRFHLLVGNGIYDTQTSMGAARLMIDQSGWNPNRVTLRYYDGGHMGYSVPATAKAIGEDIRRLVTQ